MVARLYSVYRVGRPGQLRTLYSVVVVDRLRDYEAVDRPDARAPSWRGPLNSCGGKSGEQGDGGTVEQGESSRLYTVMDRESVSDADCRRLDRP